MQRYSYMNHNKKYVLLLFAMIVLVSCHSIKVHKTNMHTSTTAPVAIGIIGLQDNGMLQSDFREVALPKYESAIRLGVSKVQFDSNTYKTYTRQSGGNKHNITYIDSLDTKPYFLKMEILDQITLLSELKKETNAHVTEFIGSQKDAVLVSAVSLAIEPQSIQEILDAEAVFLVNQNYKQYQISLVRGGKSYKTIDFAATSIFGYHLSHFCWSANSKRKIVISDLIDENSSCPKNSYRDERKAKEKTDYFKL